MMKIASRIMVAVAATGMMVAPIAAQAGTRASSSDSVYSVSASQPGLARAAGGESIKGGISIVLALLAAAAVIGGIIAATSSDDNGQSPGT